MSCPLWYVRNSTEKVTKWCWIKGRLCKLENSSGMRILIKTIHRKIYNKVNLTLFETKIVDEYYTEFFYIRRLILSWFIKFS
jgi:hypothetical protein